jgi:hypothetical protein
MSTILLAGPDLLSSVSSPPGGAAVPHTQLPHGPGHPGLYGGAVAPLPTLSGCGSSAVKRPGQQQLCHGGPAAGVPGLS